MVEDDAMTSTANANTQGRNRFGLLKEARTVLEPFRLAAKSQQLVRRTRRPTSVLVLPGFGANDGSTIPLRWYLSRIGHHVEGWELGVHGSDVTATLDRFIPRLERAVAASDGPITLVGWSLGGVVARESARERPELVEQVVTFGSPINWQRKRRPIRVPVTTIYSRNDGVVEWRHAIDDDTPGALNVEVNSTHIGLGVDPDVWIHIADAVEQRPGSPVPNQGRQTPDVRIVDLTEGET